MWKVAGSVRVGIPRGLFWYYAPGSYEVFWEALGFEVVQSPPTNREIFEEGLRLAHEELCMPAKIFHGHVAFLKDRVDFIFIPRIVSMMKRRRKRYGCPKFMGLPELIKSSVPSLPPVINVDIDLAGNSLDHAFLSLRNSLGLKETAIRHAVGEMVNFERVNTPYATLPSDNEKVRIGVVGHPYILYDPYLSMNLLNKLSSYVSDYLTSAEVPRNVIESELRPEIDLYWIYERELVGAASFFVNNSHFDGCLHCVSFGCGPGSVIMEIVERKIVGRKDFPFFTLVMDENIAETGLLTRLETFCDIVRMRKS